MAQSSMLCFSLSGVIIRMRVVPKRTVEGPGGKRA